MYILTDPAYLLRSGHPSPDAFAKPASAASADDARPGQKFCFLCREVLPRNNFYASRTGSDGLSATCCRHMSREEADRREAWACEQLRRAGVHPFSPLVPDE